MGAPTTLVSALTAQGITAPFPIQRDTLPDALAGRDVLGRGKTGSGKTLAFSIPMVARLAASASGKRRRAGRPRGLVLAPTRELATQITATLEPLAAAENLVVTTIFGGVSQNRQVTALSAGVDIVVACPGRLEDLMRQHYVTLDAIEVTVLDEADHMADLGFLPGVTRIMNATPDRGQRLLFSATLDNGVDKLVKKFLTDPVLHSVDDATSPVAAMTHHVYDVAGTTEKKALVEKLASGTGRRILFMRTKHQARKLARQLTDAGIPSVDLHGNLSQNARDRNLAAFSSGEARVLVATDVAARGVHVDGVELVVHVDPPAEHKAYLHRSGRTARAGSAGDVVTLVLPDQRKDLAVLMRKAAIKVSPVPTTAASPHVASLVGAEAPRVAPPAKDAPAQHKQNSGGRGRPARGRNGRPADRPQSQSRRGQGQASGGRGQSQGATGRGEGGQQRHSADGRPGRSGGGRPGRSGAGRPGAARTGGGARSGQRRRSQGQSFS
nr:DEAD/DEAH box helicase [Rhodococcus sp. HNM0569]